MSNERLTARQQQIHAFIEHMLDSEGRPPTRAEICQAFGFRSPNAAESHLRALAAKGAIRLEGGMARGISLPKARGLPLVGRVAAGSPMLAIEHVESHHPIDPGLFSPPADYLLRVRGMSMRDAGILEDDLLAVARTPEARSGQIVVARVDEEVTVKTFQRHGALVRLLPANPDFSPIEIDTRRESIVIEGCVVGLIRNGIQAI